MVKSVAEAFECSYEITFNDITVPVVNHPKLAARVRYLMEQAFGVENVIGEFKTMGAEDFAYIAEKVPSVFFFVGAENPEIGAVHPHHSPFFKVDEGALAIGTRAILRAIHGLHEGGF